MDDRKNHGILFDILENKPSLDGKELIQVLRIEVPHVTDLRDLSRFTLNVVNSGQALLLERPTYSKVWMDIYQKYQDKEDILCGLTKISHDIRVNKARENSWTMTKVLMKLPEGEHCTFDLSSKCTMGDGPVEKTEARQVEFDTYLPALDGLYTDGLLVQPLVWHVRLANVERKVLKVVTKTEDLYSPFSGMSIK